MPSEKIVALELSESEKCGWCKNFLWFNAKKDYYCSNCRVFNDQIDDITFCINCGDQLPEDEAPIILFSNPQRTYCHVCFDFLVKNGDIKIG